MTEQLTQNWVIISYNSIMTFLSYTSSYVQCLIYLEWMNYALNVLHAPKKNKNTSYI